MDKHIMKSLKNMYISDEWQISSIIYLIKSLSIMDIFNWLRWETF